MVYVFIMFNDTNNCPNRNPNPNLFSSAKSAKSLSTTSSAPSSGPGGTRLL
jgi:hypothetical protein